LIKLRSLASTAAFSLVLSINTVQSATIETDIVIAGGSFSATAAAFSAARENPDSDVLLIEPGDWLGGQATMQGVAAIDNVWYAPANSIMANNPDLYYPADYLAWLDEMRNAPIMAPGIGYSGLSGWVSRDCYDPRTGAWALDQMALDFPNLTIMKLAVIKDVTTTSINDAYGSGLQIEDLTVIERTPINNYEPFSDFLSQEMPDWYDSNDSTRFTKEVHTIVPVDETTGLVVIDATETGDVMVLAGAKYTQGRERFTEKVTIDGTLPEINDEQSLALVYPFAMTTTDQADDESELKDPWPNFDTTLQQRTNDYFGIGSFKWEEIWTYRRLFANGSTSFMVVNAGDVSMQNWNPGNDYRQGNWLLSKADTEAQKSDWLGGVNLTTLALAEEHATAWYFWLKERKPVSFPSTDTDFLNGDDFMNMMGTEHGLAKFPYIRGTRRLVGLANFRITSRYWINTLGADYNDETSYRFYDSVGIGNYAADTRAIFGSTGTSPEFERPAPFYIPFRALASDNVRNLLASGKVMAQTYITNTAYRLHPIEWVSGSAAGVAASMMNETNASNYDLLQIPSLRNLQSTIAENSPLGWEYVNDPVIPPNDGDLVINDFDPLNTSTPFDIEAFHPSAVSMDVYADGSFFASSSLRANGSVILQSDGIVSTEDTIFFEVFLKDEMGTELARLSDTVEFAGLSCDQDPTVTDNDEFNLFSISGGNWSTGTSQPDRWCEGSYRFRAGNQILSTATWQLKIPQTGVYRISVWYPASSNRATNSPFTVVHRNGEDTTRINQRENGGQWVELGEYEFESNTGSVYLTNDIGGSADLVLADAVRAEFINPIVRDVDDSWIYY